jgi:FkbM family methyltransferase
MQKNKKYLDNFELVRYGKEEVEKNPNKDQLIKIEKYSNWKYQLPLIISRKKLIDNDGKFINPYYYEIFEQYLMLKYIKPNDIVLEIGARYGVVSNTINLLLNDRTKHVVVEPDLTVIDALKQNRKIFNSSFSIVNRPISNDKNLYFVLNDIGSYVTSGKPKEKSIKIKTISSKTFFKKYPFKFNVLVVDCEGCLEKILDENLFLLKQLELIIFERDNETKCDYEKIYEILFNNNFLQADQLLDNFQQVWIKKSK